MIPNNRQARLAGFIYLIVVVFGVFSEFVRSSLIVTGNAAATADKIIANGILFRLGFVSDLVMMTAFLLLPLALYKLLNSVNKNQAILMIIFATIGVSINMINLLNEYAAFHLLNGPKYLNVFNAEQLKAQAMLYIDLYSNGYQIASIFFGLWLLPLGLLVYKSGFLPRVLGILFLVVSCCMLLYVFTRFLVPGLEEKLGIILLIPGAFTEISFMLWILIRGINESKVKSS